MVINPIVGVYIPIIRIPIKGGMTIPNIATLDHGTSDGHKNFGSCMFFLEADGSMRATGWDTRARVENEETRFR